LVTSRSFVIGLLKKKFFRHGYRKYEFPQTEDQNLTIRVRVEVAAAARKMKTAPGVSAKGELGIIRDSVANIMTFMAMTS
jgi:hypothetical protein